MMKKIFYAHTLALLFCSFLFLFSSCDSSDDGDDVYRLVLTSEQIETESQLMADAINSVLPIFRQCTDTRQIDNYLSELRASAAIEDAWTDSQTLFVKIKGWGTIFFLYPPQDDNSYDDLQQESLSRFSIFSPIGGQTSAGDNNDAHHFVQPQKVRVLCQRYRDDNFSEKLSWAHALVEDFTRCGISDAAVVTAPSVEYFRTGMSDCDVVFLMTHGCYDEKSRLHWLLTGEAMHDVVGSQPESYTKAMCLPLIEQVNKEYNSPREVSVGFVQEQRGDTVHTVFYKMVSELFVKNKMSHFSNAGRVVLYNTACQSLKGQSTAALGLASAFFGKGVGCYLGWNEVNNIGDRAGIEFFENMLSGMSATVAKKNLRSILQSQVFKGVNTKLDIVVDEGKRTGTLCLIHPMTEPSQQEKYSGRMRTVLHGSMHSMGVISGKAYGFEISDREDMSNIVDRIEMECHNSGGDCVFSNAKRTISFLAPVDEEKVQLSDPSKTYYFRAVLNDGSYICRGDVLPIVAESLGERGLFELHGPVKSMTRMYFGYQDSYTFDSRGMWLTYNGLSLSSYFNGGIERDAQGRIVRGTYDGGYEEYSYDTQGRVRRYGFLLWDTSEEEYYEYGDNGLVSRIKVIEGGLDAAPEPYYMTFYDVVVDAYGNWIRRSSHSIYGSYQQTRTIVYYDE